MRFSSGKGHLKARLTVSWATPILKTIRTHAWKNTINGQFSSKKIPQPAELYDLKNDPVELVNLARNPEHAAIEEELRDKLLVWCEAEGDFPTGFGPHKKIGPADSTKKKAGPRP